MCVRFRVMAFAGVLLVAACAAEPAIQRMATARSLSRDLVQQFASAVVATDQAAAFTQVERTAQSLAPLLDSLDYQPEARLLASFRARFGEYQAVVALERKGALRARCEDDLRALQQLLEKRDVEATR